MLCAVQRAQPPPPEALEGFQGAGHRDGLVEQAIESGGRGAVEHLADVIIGGDFGHAEQGLAVRPALPGGQPDIAHRIGVWTGWPFTPVGQAGANLAQFADQGIDDAYKCIDSEETGRSKQNRQPCRP